jgi:hypothetical protein
MKSQEDGAAKTQEFAFQVRNLYYGGRPLTVSDKNMSIAMPENRQTAG